MSIEKAIIFKKYPELIIRYIEQKTKTKINVSNIYYIRSDNNLKMKHVVFHVVYNID